MCCTTRETSLNKNASLSLSFHLYYGQSESLYSAVKMVKTSFILSKERKKIHKVSVMTACIEKAQPWVIRFIHLCVEGSDKWLLLPHRRKVKF